MNRSMIDMCVTCHFEVREDQHAMECDRCAAWTHRNCDTGITRELYLAATRGEITLDFECRDCSPPLDETIEARDDGNSDDLFSESDADDDMDNFAVDISFIRPPDIIEESLLEPEPTDEPMEEGPTTYHELEDGTQKGKRSLTDSLGFRYAVNKKPTPTNPTTYWRCYIRKEGHTCPATVRERGGVYTRGEKPHDHACEPGITRATKIIRDIKRIARNNIYDSANSIVEDILQENVDDREPIAAIPKNSYLKRTANRTRAKLRPQDPRGLDFDLDLDHVPHNFLIGDIRVEGNRHLVFATPQQLALLQTASTWFIDGTFKIVRDPFVQLFSIHAFIQSGGEMKQVPLAYALMSRKTIDDYVRVLQCIRDRLPGIILMKNVVLDFESGMWGALRRLFPRARLLGCGFHWAQAIFRHVQSTGLEPAFRHDDPTYRLIKTILALPYLPAEHIPASFRMLRRKATTAQLRTLMEYIETTWMSNATWPVSCWSVYGRSIRTNNDVEGWHRRVNVKSRGKRSMYELIGLLHKEGKFVKTQMRLVTEKKLQRTQKKAQRDNNARIMLLWDQYDNKTKTAGQLLREASFLSGAAFY